MQLVVNNTENTEVIEEMVSHISISVSSGGNKYRVIVEKGLEEIEHEVNGGYALEHLLSEILGY